MADDSSKNPTEVLCDAITEFVGGLDCLYTTLPLLMKVVDTVTKERNRLFLTFLDEHTIERSENGSKVSYTLKVDDIGKHDRLKRQCVNARTAQVFIPRHFITSLVSQYDSFLGNIVRFIFAVKPEALNASEKSVPYTELQKFESIKAVSEYIVEKEVETVIRKSPADQFAWLKEKLGIPFKKDLKVWPIFVELNERRNLFVHCDGHVSAHYLACCSEHECEIDPELGAGDQLGVNPEYFEQAYKCVFEIGVKMAHVVWRKLCPTDLVASDENINSLTYDLIQNKQYDLAISLLDFFTEPVFKHSNETNKRTMIVNRAQAYKWAGDAAGCAKVLDVLDWGATEDQFKLAVSVLRDDFDGAYKIMRRLRHDEYFPKAYYRDWPIFKELRKQETFLTVFEECYGKPFNVQKRTEEQIQIDLQSSAQAGTENPQAEVKPPDRG
jgi:hypothetical protein